MCGVTEAAIAGLILSSASAAYSVDAQNESAKAQQRALDIQAQQQAEETAVVRDEEIGQRVAEARRAAARRLVAAGEAGVGGQSTNLTVLNDFGAANQDAAKVAKQAAFTTRSNENSYRAALSSITRTNAFGAGLQIANAGVSGAQSGYSLGKQVFKGKGP